jgi:hypothetical protein
MLAASASAAAAALATTFRFSVLFVAAVASHPVSESLGFGR